MKYKVGLYLANGLVTTIEVEVENVSEIMGKIKTSPEGQRVLDEAKREKVKFSWSGEVVEKP
jgi:hypothetical protein